MEKIPSPLQAIMAEVEKALEAGFYYLAISGVLTLPDVCVSLASSNGQNNANAYATWCDNNLSDNFAYVTGKDLWSMRCGVLHNGRFGNLKHNVARVAFSLPNPLGATFVDCAINDAYFYSATNFCRNFMADVRRWYASHEYDPVVIERMKRMIQYYPNGLSPYVDGAPILA